MPRARSRLIASPSPVPSCGLFSARPTCTNGSKIAASRSAGIPVPVSCTRSRASVAVPTSTVSTCSVTRPAGAVNLIAFDRRLSSTCTSFSRSADTCTPAAASSVAPVASSASPFASSCGSISGTTSRTTSASVTARMSNSTRPLSSRA